MRVNLSATLMCAMALETEIEKNNSFAKIKVLFVYHQYALFFGLG